MQPGVTSEDVRAGSSRPVPFGTTPGASSTREGLLSKLYAVAVLLCDRIHCRPKEEIGFRLGPGIRLERISRLPV